MEGGVPTQHCIQEAFKSVGLLHTQLALQQQCNAAESWLSCQISLPVFASDDMHHNHGLL
jgi:hypothetical protein